MKTLKASTVEDLINALRQYPNDVFVSIDGFYADDVAVEYEEETELTDANVNLRRWIN